MRKDLKDETDNILSEEGFESAVYLDSMGIGTIGHGLTWMTEEESSNIVYKRAPGSLMWLTTVSYTHLTLPTN